MKLVTTAALTAAASLQAQLLIDNYNDPAGGQSIVLAADGSDSTGDQAAAVLGGSRDVLIEGAIGTGGPAEAGANINGSGAGELLNSVGSQARATFNYDAFGAGLNLALDAAWNFEYFAAVDQPTLFSIVLTDGSGLTSTWTTPAPVAAGFAGTISVPPIGMSFVPEAGFDLSDVDAIAFNLLPLAAAGDVHVDDLLIVVPEPGVYAGLFALGLAGFAARRRLRR